MSELRTFRSKEYKAWYNGLSSKDRRIVDSRVDVARKQGILIKYKLLDANYSLYEFKWDNGLRVYFSLLRDSGGNFMLVLTAGNKNSQSKDIRESKNIITKAVKSIKEKLSKDEDKENERT